MVGWHIYHAITKKQKKTTHHPHGQQVVLYQISSIPDKTCRRSGTKLVQERKNLHFMEFYQTQIRLIFAFYCSIGFIVGMSSTSSYKPLFLDITLHLKGYFSPFHLHLYTSLYPNCIVWRMNWRKWRMAYLAYALFYSSGSFHCANWRSRFSNSDFRSSLVTSA